MIPSLDVPPTRDQAPVRAVMVTVDPRQIGELCQGLGVGERWAEACTDTRSRPPVIYLPNPFDMPSGETERLLKHELGHANGWPADHPR